MYTETESAINEKEQQVKKLQLQESEALASDNYDLAEEISNRIEQLKADLESSRYRLPAQDEKVNNGMPKILVIPLGLYNFLRVF